MNSGVQFTQRAFDLDFVSALEIAAQQTQLDLEKGQALGNRVVQFTRDESALRPACQ
jgi:hypothetical protein